MRRVLATGVLVTVLGAAAGPLGAQESFFSLQFLGVSEESAGGRARGMGIQGTGVGDTRTSLALNPGSLGALEQMTFSAMGVSGVRTSSDRSLEQSAGLARFPHVRVALPLFGKVVAHAGFVGMRNFRADFQLPSREADGLAYTQSFDRDGTLYQIPFGVSGSLGPRLHVGATLDFVLGTVDERWVTEGDSIVALASRRRDEMTGRTVTVGFVARPTQRVQLGVSWSPQFEIDRNRRTTLEDARANSTAAPLRDGSTNDTFTYPQVVRVGAGVELGSAWLLATDYMWREWEAYGGDPYEAEAVGNETRVGGGVNWNPKPRVHYRAGLSRATWPQFVGGERLHETAVHFGLGIDIRGEGGRFDVALEHGWIGSLDNNGRQERTWRVIVSLAGQEVWRRKSPRTR